MTLYARAGEFVTCTRGHDVCEIAHDIMVGDSYDPDNLTNWVEAPPSQVTPLPPGKGGDGKCWCGSKFWEDRALTAGGMVGATLHIWGNWRDRPIGYVPKRREYPTLEDLIRAEDARLAKEEAADLAERLAGAAPPLARPRIKEHVPWYLRLWRWIVRLFAGTAS